MIVWRLAVRNLIRQRRLSALSLVSVSLSVLITMCMFGFVNGLDKLLTDSVIYKTTGALQVHKKGFVDNVRATPFDFVFPLTPELETIISETPGVTAHTGRLPFGGILSAGDQSVVTPIVAIDPDREMRVCPKAAEAVVVGKPVTDGGLVMSPQLARRFGEKRDLVAVSQDTDGVLNAVEVKTSGTLNDIPIMMANKRLAYIALKDAQSLLRVDGVLEVAVQVANPKRVDVVANALRARLPATYEVHTWAERNPSLVRTLAQRRQIFDFLSRMFIVLALIGVVNTMLMSVVGRVREIGTMMALGTARKTIARLFLIEAFLLGIVGGALGIAGGLSLVSYFGHVGFPLDVPGTSVKSLMFPYLSVMDCLSPFFFVLVGVVVAAAYPAVKATKLEPVSALSSL